MERDYGNNSSWIVDETVHADADVEYGNCVDDDDDCVYAEYVGDTVNYGGNSCCVVVVVDLDFHQNDENHG